jgi:thiosulfate dehydrogenase [quinone] large subunit
MDFPYISDTNNFIVDEHIVYAGVLLLLIVEKAGYVFGLDAWAEKLDLFRRNANLRWLVS